MKIDKKTKIFCSISSHAGMFGSRFFNNFFQETNFNALYKPIELKTDSWSEFDDLMCALVDSRIIYGIAVSMPYKKWLYEWCQYQHVPCQVSNVNNINTLVLNTDNCFAINTDVIGFENACQEALKNSRYAYVYGNGAVSNSICSILKKNDLNFHVVRRGEEKIFRSLFRYRKDFLINASPVGMDYCEDVIFTKQNVKDWRYIFDVVGKPETNLTKIGKQQGATVIKGPAMQLEGACEQFKLYTGMQLSKENAKAYMRTQGLYN